MVFAGRVSHGVRRPSTRIRGLTHRTSAVIQAAEAPSFARAMTVRIETPTGRDSLTEFVTFHDRVYEGRGAHWPVATELELPVLLGESPFNAGRRIRPFT